MGKERRRKIFMESVFEKNILKLVCFSFVIPLALAIFFLYFFIFKLIVSSDGLSEAVILNLISWVRKISFTLLAITIFILFILSRLTLRLTHKIFGPLYRLEKEISERFIFDKKGPVLIRKSDELRSLVEKINKLLETKNY